MKKIFLLMLIISMVMGFFTLGYSSEQQEAIKLIGYTSMAEDHSATIALRNAAKKVEAATDGGLLIEVYPDSILGDYTTVFEEIMLGTVDIGLMSITAQYDERLQLLFVPYLFTTYEQAEAVFNPDSNTSQLLNTIYSNLGIKHLGVYGLGFVGVGTTKLDPNYLDPLAPKNTVLRVWPSEATKLTLEAMNYPNVTIPYADLYTALQTGVCDGWLGGTAENNYHSFRDIVKYYIGYNVLMENFGFVMNKAKYDSLPDDYKKILDDVAAELCQESLIEAREVEQDSMKKLEDYGIEVITIPEEQLTKIAEHVRNYVWPKIEPSMTSEVMDTLRKDVSK